MHSTKQFTKEEKDVCLPIIDELIRYSITTQKEGVLILENIVDDKNYFLKFLSSLVAHCIDPPTVKELAETLINAEEHTGRELLERIIITKGILLIQAREQPHWLEYKLRGLLGESYMKLHYRADCVPLEQVELAVQHFEEMALETPLQKCIFFDRGIQTYSEEDMRLIMEIADEKDITLIVKGCGRAAARKIGLGVTKRWQKDLKYFMDDFGEATIEDILDAQNRVKENISQLAKNGLVRKFIGVFD